MNRRAVVEQPQESFEPVLITKQQAAAWAQVSVSKISQWMDEDGFPAIRTPRQVRIHARKFEEWLAAKAGGEW